MAETIMIGTVVHWNKGKGFGFLEPLYGDLGDVFVHASSLPGKPGRKNLTVGAKVEFEIDALDGKIFAKNVQVLGDENACQLQK